MALDSGEIRVFGSGHIYTAPVGTEFPDDITAAVDLGDWDELGYVTEEGARFSFGREVNRIMSWQSFDPTRIIVTAVPKTIAFDLQQWNSATIPFALGGGEITEPSPGAYQYDPPDESELAQKALIVEGLDGDYTYRFCYRKVISDSAAEFAFVRAEESRFPVTMAVLAADDGAKPYIIQSDDPAFEALAS